MSICPLSAKTVDAVKKGKVEPVFVQKDDNRNMYFVYTDPDVLQSVGMMKNDVKSNLKAVDVIAPNHKIGRIDLPAGADTSKLDEIISGDYHMTITALSGNVLQAEITISDNAPVRQDNGMSPALEEAWNHALSLGAPFDEDFKDTVMQFFAVHNIDESLRLEIVSGYEVPIDKHGNPAHLTKPASMLMATDTFNEKNVYGESYASTTLRQAIDGNPLILSGPKSVGKNFIVEWCAYVLGAPYYETSVDQDMLKSELFGDKVFDTTASQYLTKEGAKAYLAAQNGEETDAAAAVDYEYWKTYNAAMRFIVEDTEFNRWLLQKEGRRVLMVNEINYGSAVILAEVFNPVAEDRPVHFIEVPGYGRVEIDSRCILTASMNEGYVGTVELNEAMRSRFGFLEVQPSEHIGHILKNKIESEVGKGVLADAYYKACDKLYVYMLKRARSGGSGAAQYGDKTLSIRNFGRALKTVARSGGRVTLASQLNLQLRGQCDGPQERASLSDDIRDIIGKL